MNDPQLEPVSRQSTAAIIADRLRDAITRGAFPPGAQLGEVDLAARLGVSRGPLREAMQRLVQEGLLRGERHRGLFVVELGLADVHDIYAARLVVEQAAAGLILRGGDTHACAQAGAPDGQITIFSMVTASAHSASPSATRLTLEEGTPKAASKKQTTAQMRSMVNMRELRGSASTLHAQVGANALRLMSRSERSGYDIWKSGPRNSAPIGAVSRYAI